MIDVDDPANTISLLRYIIMDGIQNRVTLARQRKPDCTEEEEEEEVSRDMFDYALQCLIGNT